MINLNCVFLEFLVHARWPDDLNIERFFLNFAVNIVAFPSIVNVTTAKTTTTSKFHFFFLDDDDCCVVSPVVVDKLGTSDPSVFSHDLSIYNENIDKIISKALAQADHHSLFYVPVISKLCSMSQYFAIKSTGPLH